MRCRWWWPDWMKHCCRAGKNDDWINNLLYIVSMDGLDVHQGCPFRPPHHIHPRKTWWLHRETEDFNAPKCTDEYSAFFLFPCCSVTWAKRCWVLDYQARPGVGIILSYLLLRSIKCKFTHSFAAFKLRFHFPEDKLSSIFWSPSETQVLGHWLLWLMLAWWRNKLKQANAQSFPRDWETRTTLCGFRCPWNNYGTLLVSLQFH